MSSELDLLIVAGQDITSLKYYGVAVCTIFFYDYLLTLADEIKYAWAGKKSWSTHALWDASYLLLTSAQHFGFSLPIDIFR